MPTASVPRHNLPQHTTAFIGRDSDIRALHDLLRHPATRLITLLGPGGTGKTRLSVHLGEQYLETYSDGVWFIALEPVIDPDLVVPTLAHTLGLVESGSTPIAESVRDYLRDKHMLLIFDNFEQVVTAAPQLVDLIATAPGVQAITSSREALQVAGEQIYAVQPLPLLNPNAQLSLSEIARNPAVAVFVQQARFVKPDFVLTADNAAAIMAICARLDGLPLAIELAASRVRQFPPDRMLVALEHSLDILTRGGRDRSARQQTLRGLIEWSYGLLPVGEQMLFGRLAVFAGGFTLEAAEAICVIDGDLPITVSDGLAALFEKSLVRREATEHGIRFSMLNTIHDYAWFVLERLAPEDEEALIRARHTSFYLALVEEAEKHFNTPDQDIWWEMLEHEHENIRLVLGGNDVERAGRVVGAIHFFWRDRGYWTEARRWSQALENAALLPYTRGRVLFSNGWFALMQGDYPQAESDFRQMLHIARDIKNVSLEAKALNGLGSIAAYQGDLPAAAALFEESAAASLAAGDRRGHVSVLGNTALLLIYAGTYDQAQRVLNDVMAIDQQSANTARMAWDWCIQGWLHLLQDDIGSARRACEESLRLNQSNDQTLTLENTLYLGLVALFEGQAEQARSAFAESLRMATDIGDTFNILDTLDGCAGLLGQTGRSEGAARLFGAAEAGRKTQNFPRSTGSLPLYERLVALGQSGIEAATWDAAFAEGQTLTLADAIALAAHYL